MTIYLHKNGNETIRQTPRVCQSRTNNVISGLHSFEGLVVTRRNYTPHTINIVKLQQHNYVQRENQRSTGANMQCKFMPKNRMQMHPCHAG